MGYGTQGTKLPLPSDLGTGDNFGFSVGLSGNTVTVGAPGQAAGAVYTYLWYGSEWSLDKKFTPTSSAAFMAGRSTVVSGKTILFGVRGALDRVEVPCTA